VKLAVLVTSQRASGRAKLGDYIQINERPQKAFQAVICVWPPRGLVTVTFPDRWDGPLEEEKRVSLKSYSSECIM
jgi:hypothetical protein